MGLPQLRPEETASHDLTSSTTITACGSPSTWRRLTHQVLMEAAERHSDARCASRIRRPRSIGSSRRSARLERPCEIAFEPTGDYHRPLVYVLGQAGFQLCQVSSIAVARTRDALYNSWDKNDPKDAQVILHLLKTGTTQRYLDPLVTGHHDLQEMANTYQQVSLRKVRLQHAIVTHHLPLYFPGSRALSAQLPRRVVHRAAALDAVSGGRAPLHEGGVHRRRARAGRRPQGRQGAMARRLLRHRGHEPRAARGEDTRSHSDVSRSCSRNIVLLCRRRKRLEADVVERLAGHAGLRSACRPCRGSGRFWRLIILAEARDLRRFGHVRQFLKYCGFDLCTEQSGQFRGTTHLSKRGNARLRYAFWMAGTVAIRMQQNSFRRKFEDYMRPDPQNADRRRKAYTAVAAKMARVVYAVVTTGIDYRRFPEATRPGGRIPSPAAVEASSTS